MIYAVIGSRTFFDYEKLKNVLDKHIITKIVSGGASGADSLAARYAQEHNIPIEEFLPQWDKYGNAAGFVRNKHIVRASDVVIAFWDGVSKGTKHSIDFAPTIKKKCIVIHFDSIPTIKEENDLWQL